MYCTPSDLAARLDSRTLLALADDNADGIAELDPDPVAAAIRAAASRIDSLLAGRFSVPFSPVPPRIRDLCARIAIGQLLRRRPEAAAPAILEDAHAAQLELTRIANGIESLDIGATPAALPAASRGVANRIFTPDTLGEF